MPGFGSGPFGEEAFGEWSWTRQVLYETAPVTYRQPQNSALLRRYTQGQQVAFAKAKQRIAAFDTLRDPFTARTAYSERAFFVLGKQIVPTGKLEQAGNLGLVPAPGVFKVNDRAALFRTSDVGKQIYVKRSTNPTNNQQFFSITTVLSTSEVYTDPPVASDAGPIRWELRSLDSLPEGQFELEIRGGDPRVLNPGWSLYDGSKAHDVISRQMFYQPVTGYQLLNEREASDGVIAQPTPGTVALTSATYAFQQQDVGKLVGIVSTEARNTGVWEITAVEGGSAIFGRLSVQGLDGNPLGQLHYSYKAAADRIVTIEHRADVLPNLPLTLVLDATDPKALQIQIRLATDAAGDVSTVPSDIISLLAANTTTDAYVSVARPSGVAVTETPVGEFPQAPIKPGFLADSADVYWALRTFARVVVDGALPLGVIDGEGNDAAIEPLALTTVAFVQPAVGITVTTSVDTTDLLTVGDNVLVANAGALTGGTYEVIALNSTLLQATLQLITPGSVAPGGTVALGATIVSATSARIYSPSGPFLAGDEGKLLTLRGSAFGNDGVYTISNYLDSNYIEIEAQLTPQETGLYYARRTTPRAIPNPTQLNPQRDEVVGSAQAILDVLAYDFGISVDTQQTELRQRSWVRQVSQLAEIKGTNESVVGVATLSGFRIGDLTRETPVASVIDLYSIEAAPNMDPALFLYFIPGIGRVYSGTSLTTGGPFLETASAAFVAADLGRVVQITSPLNTGYFVIGEVVSSTKVRLLEPSVHANLDPGIPNIVPEGGPIPFAVGNLYTAEPPAYPRVDDINFDMVSAMYDLAGYPLDARPGMDVPCAVQHIKVGYDPQGYAKASLDCGALGGGDYDAILEAHTAGSDGDFLQFALISGAAFNLAVSGNVVTATFQPAVTYPFQIDNAIAGLTVNNVLTPSGTVVVQTATPHGLSMHADIVVSGVTIPTEANGVWKADVLSPTQVRLLDSSLNPVFGISPYLGGGVLHNKAVVEKIALKQASGVITPINVAFAPTNFAGGAGLNPPQVVSLDPPTGLSIAAVPPPSSVGQIWTFYVEGEDAGAVLGGPWKFIDAAGRSFFLDSAPTLVSASPWVYKVVTTAAVSPTPGPMHFEYLCAPEYSCDACATNRVAIYLTSDKVVLEGSVAQESAFERVIARVNEILPVNAVPSYRLSQYLLTAPLFTSGEPSLPVEPVRLVWTDYARATYTSPGSPPVLSFFRVGLGGANNDGAIKPPDPALANLDILQNPGDYTEQFPNPPYTLPSYQKAFTASTLVTDLYTGGTALHASCRLEVTEYNSDGVGTPVIREIGFFDTAGFMVAYGTLGGIQKTSERTVTFEAYLVL